MPLHVAVLELPARFGRRDEALADVDQQLSRVAAGSLVVLPEASLTGYVSPAGSFDLGAFAEPLDGPTSNALAALAKKHRVSLVGPLVERDGDARFNAMVGFDASGERWLHYRKEHPWYPETWATPGARGVSVEHLGVTIAIAVCFDIHFASTERAAQLDAADVLLFPSAWVDDDGDTRTPLLITLALKHHVAVVNANWARGDVVSMGQGNSVILDAQGRCITKRSGSLVTATLADKER